MSPLHKKDEGFLHLLQMETRESALSSWTCIIWFKKLETVWKDKLLV